MEYRGSRTSKPIVIVNINVRFVHTHARTDGDQNKLPPDLRHLRKPRVLSPLRPYGTKWT